MDKNRKTYMEVRRETFNDYQAQAWDTALYPSFGNNFVYPVLGLAGEYGEFDETMFHKGVGVESEKELGDIAWYISAIAMEFDIALGDLALNAVGKKEDRLGFIKAIGRVSEIAKKIIRDHNGVIQVEHRNKMYDALTLCVQAWENQCKVLGFTPEKVLASNLDKLFDRKERGVLQGSGDNR